MYGAFVQYSPLNLWRLVTPIFVHIGVEHFLFNMLALYFMGKMAEQIFGTLRFLGLYLLAGVMGNAFTLLLRLMLLRLALRHPCLDFLRLL